MQENIYIRILYIIVNMSIHVILPFFCKITFSVIKIIIKIIMLKIIKRIIITLFVLEKNQV